MKFNIFAALISKIFDMFTHPIHFNHIFPVFLFLFFYKEIIYLKHLILKDLYYILQVAMFCESGVKRMANIKSAKKRISVINKKTAVNKRIKSHLKEVIKSFESNVADGNTSDAEKDLKLAEKKLMQAASKGTIHKNAASRKVSRMTKALNNLKAE